MAVGKRVKWRQLVGVAVLAGAAVSAQAASSQAAAHSQGSANAFANGQSNASGSSVLNGSTAASTSNGNGNSGGSSGSAPTSTGTVVTSAGTTGAAAAASTTPGGITYGVDGFNNLAAANAFYGLVSGNDNAGINNLATNWGGGWTLAGKDNTDSGDDVANRVLGIGFSVDAGGKDSAGHWSLGGSGLGSGSVLLDVVAVLKSSNQYGLYFFQNVVFDGAVGGEWLSPSFNARGERQDLSHLSIYVRAGSDQSPLARPEGVRADTEGGGLAAPRAVPEPGTLALFSAALLALAVIRSKAVRRC